MAKGNRTFRRFYKECRELLEQIEKTWVVYYGIMGHSLPRQIQMIQHSNYSVGVKRFCESVIIARFRRKYEL